MENDTRKKIRLGDSTQDVLFAMAEGNPGALNVLINIIKDEPMSILTVLHLDDMNIRGTQIWIAFKDFAKQDMGVFLEALKSRDQNMVDIVNREGVMGNHPHIAVTSGASFQKGI